MLSFRSLVFGILITGGVSYAQDSTTAVSELQSLETANPMEDSSTTADVVVKGFIPDLQRAQMVEDAVSGAKKVEQKKEAAAEAAANAKAAAAAKAAKQATVVAEKKSDATNEKKTETVAEKERKAKEAADRANGIIPGKATAAAATKTKTTATAKSDTTKSNGSAPINLDTKSSVGTQAEATPAAQKTIVEEVPLAAGKSVTIKKTAPIQTNSPEVATANPESAASAPNELTITGRVVSARPGSNGKLKLMVNSAKNGQVEVVVEPRVGMRVPVAGASVSVHGTKLSSDADTLVMRADSIDRADGVSTSRVVYQHGYARHIVPQLPVGPPGRFGPPMVYGPPPPPPYF